MLELGDELLIVMEYVDGESLRQRLRAPMPLATFWDFSSQCLEALGAAHTHGIIHRDIKPENLMVTRGNEIKILDFGIAWRTPRGDGTSPEGATTATTELHRGPAGTPLYMAPEAHYGGRIDERTDVFSLGAVFYEMLTARHPFAGDTYEHVLHRIMNTTPKPASELNPAVTPELAGVVARMLERDPAQRYASCADVRAALLTTKRASGGVLTSEETLALSLKPTKPPGRPRWGWKPALVLLGVVAVGGIVARVAMAPRLPAERRLAILPPAVPGAREEFATFSVGALELLSSRLLRHQARPGFQMSTIAESYDGKLTTVSEARSVLGANLVLIPTLSQQEGTLRARLELRESAKGRSFGARDIVVPLEQPYAFMDSLYRGAAHLLDLAPESRTMAQVLGIQGPGTLRFLLQGIGRYRRAETAEATERSFEDLETAQRTAPDAAVPLAWIAAVQYQCAELTKDTAWVVRAEASARSSLALDSTCVLAHRTLGWALGHRKHYPESLEHFRRASELEPSDDIAWHRWARTWQRMGDAEREKQVYVAAIALRPHCWKPRWWLASWEYRNGRVEESIRDYREMIGRSPELFTGYQALGGLLVLQGQYAHAIDTLRLAVALRPTAAAFNNLGAAYFDSGRLSEAVDAYNQAFQFGDADYVTWFNLGDAYFWLRNRPDQARGAYRQSVRLGLEQMAEREARGSSPDPVIPATLAVIYPRLGAPDSARTMLRTALAIDSLNSRVQYDAALALWGLGERERALDWLTRAVAGGYPVAWIRDSPVHREWRGTPGFDAVVANAAAALQREDSPGTGGRR